MISNKAFYIYIYHPTDIPLLLLYQSEALAEMRNSSMGSPRGIDPITHHVRAENSKVTAD